MSKFICIELHIDLISNTIKRAKKIGICIERRITFFQHTKNVLVVRSSISPLCRNKTHCRISGLCIHSMQEIRECPLVCLTL